MQLHPWVSATPGPNRYKPWDGERWLAPFASFGSQEIPQLSRNPPYPRAYLYLIVIEKASFKLKMPL